MSGNVIINMCQPGGGGGASAPTALVINITGTWGTEPALTVVPQHAYQFGAGFYTGTGPWTANINLESGATEGLTGFEFANLSGITGNIAVESEADLATAEFPVLVAVGGSLSFSGSDLTTFSVPSLRYIGAAFEFGSSPLLEELDLPVLEVVIGHFAPSSLDILTDLLAPALTYVGADFAPATLPLVDTVDFTALVEVRGGFTLSGLSALLSVSFPALVNVGNLIGVSGDLFIENLTACVSVDFAALETVGDGIVVEGCGSLTDYLLGAITNIGGSVSFENGTDALDTFTFGSGLLAVGGDATLTSCALLEASVDNILVRLADLDGTGGTTSYDNHTVTITGTSEPPGVAGAAAKLTLEGRGNTVTVN